MLKSTFSNFVEAGTDEAGRGCLAGPVTAAAVILPADFKQEGLNDSKKLSRKSRYELKEIIEAHALCFSVCHIYPETIDRINILNASIMAMHHALEQLKTEPEFIAVDGNRFKVFKNIPHQCIIKGDAKYLNIAAASILAKTYRDNYMENLHNSFPVYNWLNNKGYPTTEHRKAIKEFGICEHHRKSFRLLPEQLEIQF